MRFFTGASEHPNLHGLYTLGTGYIVNIVYLAFKPVFVELPIVKFITVCTSWCTFFIIHPTVHENFRRRYAANLDHGIVCYVDGLGVKSQLFK